MQSLGWIVIRAAGALAGTMLVLGGATAADKVVKSHGLTLVGALGYPPDFAHRSYVNPHAPKGGAVKLHSIGSFDSFNPYIVKGDPASLRFVVETLMTSPLDEVSAEYGLIAETVEIPDDLSYAIYNLRPEARFHDGKPVTADDVIFSFKALREKGRPFYRFYYRNIVKAERLGRHRVKFHFTGPPIASFRRSPGSFRSCRSITGKAARSTGPRSSRRSAAAPTGSRASKRGGSSSSNGSGTTGAKGSP